MIQDMKRLLSKPIFIRNSLLLREKYKLKQNVNPIKNAYQIRILIYI